MTKKINTASMFRALVENSPDIIVRYDLQGRRLYANLAWAQLTGLDVSEGLGKTVLELPTISDPVSYHRKLMAAASGQEEEAELVFENCALGKCCYIHARFLLEQDADGQVLGMIMVGRNITEHKRIEQDLIQREREFRTLAESSPDSIIRYDLDQRILYVNDKLLHTLDLISADGVIGRRPCEIWPDGRFEAIEAASQRVMNSGESQEDRKSVV